MTATNLQIALAKDIAEIFKGDLFKDSAGQYVPINIFEQYLPIRKDEDEPDPVPYVIVKIEEGKVSSWVEGYQNNIDRRVL